MPFRDKVKKAFGKSNDDPSETSLDLSEVQTKASTKKSKKRKAEYPDNVYKPGEMPESKYKGPYDKKHQQKLHAFSFASAFEGRRKSEQSLYSPMGSRLPSRMSSFISRRSWAPKSRQQSRVEDTLMENSEADDAVENVGMSRQHTREEVPRIQFQEDIRPRAKESEKAGGADNFRSREGNTVNGTSDYLHGQSNQPNALGPNYVNDVDRMEGLESTMTLTKGEYRPVSFGQPFSADDLVRAMDQSTLKPAAVQA